MACPTHSTRPARQAVTVPPSLLWWFPRRWFMALGQVPNGIAVRLRQCRMVPTQTHTTSTARGSRHAVERVGLFWGEFGGDTLSKTFRNNHPGWLIDSFPLRKVGTFQPTFPAGWDLTSIDPCHDRRPHCRSTPGSTGRCFFLQIGPQQVWTNRESMGMCRQWRKNLLCINLNTRWFFVTFSSPSWRSLNHFKRSLKHPKKVTKNCLVLAI